MSLAYRCQTCHGAPMWTLTRMGDVVTTWACAEHLSRILLGLQRDYEVTKIEVHLYAKAIEWAEISRSLIKIKESPE